MLLSLVTFSDQCGRVDTLVDQFSVRHALLNRGAPALSGLWAVMTYWQILLQRR
jgi:hypothetical protein